MNKFVIGLILTLIVQQAMAQDMTWNERVKSIDLLYYPADTVLTKGDKNSVTVTVVWMDSVIQVRKTTRIKYDLEEIRKFRRDPTYVPSPADTVRFNERRKTFSQNCHSYALEKYFANVGITNDLLFTEWTSLTENYYMDKILTTAFERTRAFIPNNKKCKDCNFEEGSIVVFRNQDGTPIHSVYYDGAFHSKYGAWEARVEDNVELILKRYWDSTSIEEYHLDDKKIEVYINK